MRPTQPDSCAYCSDIPPRTIKIEIRLNFVPGCQSEKLYICDKCLKKLLEGEIPHFLSDTIEVVVGAYHYIVRSKKEAA
jgi:hypothetical protein